jgi:hypothetical protein
VLGMHALASSCLMMSLRLRLSTSGRRGHETLDSQDRGSGDRCGRSGLLDSAAANDTVRATSTHVGGVQRLSTGDTDQGCMFAPQPYTRMMTW